MCFTVKPRYLATVCPCHINGDRRGSWLNEGDYWRSL